MKTIRLKLFYTAFLFNIAYFLNASSSFLIPEPVSFVKTNGCFELSENTIIFYTNESNKADAEIFNEYLMQHYGFMAKIEPVSSFKKENCIWLEYDNNKTMPSEVYSLVIKTNEIKILGDSSGIFYALQTIKQMLPFAKQAKLEISCATIIDYPRYSWRGMHLDVARHFFPISFIKKYIDFIALYKMNTFHWHLTDDQGWRIEIKKYPKLTEIGGYRNGTLIGSYRNSLHQYDTIHYGGYYTQTEVKEIVAYAAARHITIVPEIEMPGHSLAALTAYPQFSCTGGPFDVAKEWGVFDDVFCPKEETFNFLEDVLNEVMDLFPSKYIHIGGDEVSKTNWKKCPYCQSIIKNKGFKDEAELQSYFIKRIETYVNSKGRNIIGWDEILEGGLAPNAVVMSWRGVQGGIVAAKLKHYVVMSPGAYCYFDHYQGNPKFEPLAIGGYTSVEKVYSFEPTPIELSLNEQKYILGAQANVWTEYIGTTNKVEYMIFPRICALAEVLWSPKKSRNWESFKTRLIEHFNYLDFMKINYSKALFDLIINSKKNNNGNGLNISIASDMPNPQIYYTIDGSEPSINSTKYILPFSIFTNTNLKTALFHHGVRIGNVFEQQFIVNKASGKKVTLRNPPHKTYNNGGAFTLVDGIVGIIPWYGKEWLGFLGNNLEAVVDLNKIDTISRVSVDVLKDENSWIHLPKCIKVLISKDGINFNEVKTLNYKDILVQNRKMVLEFNKTPARYVKIIAENIHKIPDSYPGASEDAWLFVDEISVE